MANKNMQLGSIQELSDKYKELFEPTVSTENESLQNQIDELTDVVMDLELFLKGIFGGHVLVNGKFIELQSLMPKGFKGTY